jgi:hypothetical protein
MKPKNSLTEDLNQDLEFSFFVINDNPPYFPKIILNKIALSWKSDLFPKLLTEHYIVNFIIYLVRCRLCVFFIGRKKILNYYEIREMLLFE